MDKKCDGKFSPCPFSDRAIFILYSGHLPHFRVEHHLHRQVHICIKNQRGGSNQIVKEGVRNDQTEDHRLGPFIPFARTRQ